MILLLPLCVSPNNTHSPTFDISLTTGRLPSINYHHAGAAKQWYGVPKRHAANFDAVAKQLAPEMFAMKKGLLDEIISQINPQTLRAQGVDVYRFGFW